MLNSYGGIAAFDLIKAESVQRMFGCLCASQMPQRGRVNHDVDPVFDDLPVLAPFVDGSAGVIHSQVRDLLSFHHPADQRSCREAYRKRGRNG